MKTFKKLLQLIVIIVILSSCGNGAKASAPQQDAPVNAPAESAANNPVAESAEQAEPASPVDLSILGESKLVDDGGFSFRVIPGYELSVLGGMASMLAPGADSDTGPVFQLIGWKNEGQKTNEQLYDELKKDTPMTVSEATSVQVAGLPGLAAEITGENNGASMRGRVVMVMVDPYQQFVLMAGVPASEWDNVSPFFDSVLASIEFFELASLPASADVSDIPTGMYAYTDTNEVRDVVVYKDVAYAATIGGMAAWNLDSGYVMQYTPLQGMTHVSAYSITYCEIPEPRILVGTLMGISIYDPNTGIWEKNSLTPPESNVDTSQINRLYCDQANNRLLIGYNGLGVLDLKTGAFQRFKKEDGLLWEAVTDITVNNQDIWVANGYDGIAKIANNKVTTYSADNGMPDKRAYSITFTKDGALWVGAASGVMSFNGNNWKMFETESSTKLGDVFEINTASDGSIWAATGIGQLCQFNPQNGDCIISYKAPESTAIFALSFSQKGAPVFGTEKGLYLFENGDARHFKTEDKLASNTITSVVSAPDKNLWIGTGAGIYVLDPASPDQEWDNYSQNDYPSMGGRRVNGIAFGPNGIVWAAIESGGASRFDNNEWVSYKEIQSFNIVVVDELGRAWFGDDRKGISVLNADGSEAFKLTSVEGLPSDNVQDMVVDAAGVVWIGTDQGLARYENEELEVVFGKDSSELLNKYIRALAVDSNGALVIGMFTGVALYDGSQVITLVDFLKDGFSKARLTELTTAPDGKIWVGTDSGLLYSDNRTDWKMLTTDDGLLTQYITALHVDSYGALWVGGGSLLHIVP